MLISKGFEPHISVGPEMSLQRGARLHVSHNVIEDLPGVWRPPACMTDYRAGPRLSVMSVFDTLKVDHLEAFRSSKS